MACAGKRLYVAYTSTGGNTVIDVFEIDANGGLHLTAKKSYRWPIKEPGDDDTTYGLPSDEPHYPIFTDGMIERSGDFLLAGFYAFIRESDCSPGHAHPCFGRDRRFYPVLVTVSPTAEVIGMYIESGTSSDAWTRERCSYNPGLKAHQCPEESLATTRAHLATSSRGRALVMLSGPELAMPERIWEAIGATRVATWVVGDLQPEHVEDPVGSDCWWHVVWWPSALATQFPDYSTRRTAMAGILATFGHHPPPSQCLAPSEHHWLRVASSSSAGPPIPATAIIAFIAGMPLW
jgi:hypothetical protein